MIQALKYDLFFFINGQTHAKAKANIQINNKAVMKWSAEKS